MLQFIREHIKSSVSTSGPLRTECLALRSQDLNNSYDFANLSLCFSPHSFKRHFPGEDSVAILTAEPLLSNSLAKALCRELCCYDTRPPEVLGYEDTVWNLYAVLQVSMVLWLFVHMTSL